MTTVPADAISAAKASAERWGVPASVSLAQWALESGWGHYEAGCRNDPPEVSHNPFGIKAVKGQPAVWITTHEGIGGKSIEVKAPFRVFNSMVEAFDEHARLLATNPVYDAAMKCTNDPDAFAMALQGRYATDPHYGGKLQAIMHGSANLVQYDVPPDPPPANDPGLAASQRAVA